MRTKHTPGKWKITPTFSHIFVSDGSGNYGVICKLPNVIQWGDCAARLENSANARLIAAAPELLEALKSLNHVNAGFCICPRNDGNAPFKMHSTACNEARTAIAKAEGKEQHESLET